MIPHVLLESAHRVGLGDVRELQWRTILGKPTVLALGATGTPHVC